MTDRNEVERLARAFLVHLDHLRTFRDVAYVSAAKMDLPPVEHAAGNPAALEPARAPAPGPTSVAVDSTSALREQARTWTPATKLEYLRRRNLGDCHRCALSQGRTNIVFGVGDPEADVMFVGEAPGADEDRLGEPFVGRAGQRLTAWIEALGLTRDRVYIANVLKCRPPGNRDPRAEEVEKCSPFLSAQIRAISPRVIIALGRHAGMLLSRSDHLTLKQMRAKQMVYEDSSATVRIPLIVTYHPAYALRQGGSGARGAEGFGPADDIALSDLRRALSIAAEQN